jgi:hypothetical protein
LSTGSENLRIRKGDLDRRAITELALELLIGHGIILQDEYPVVLLNLGFLAPPGAGLEPEN